MTWRNGVFRRESDRGRAGLLCCAESSGQFSGTVPLHFSSILGLFNLNHFKSTINQFIFFSTLVRIDNSLTWIWKHCCTFVSYLLRSLSSLNSSSHSTTLLHCIRSTYGSQQDVLRTAKSPLGELSQGSSSGRFDQFGTTVIARQCAPVWK